MPPAIDPVAILEAVLGVWREEGYQGATTRQIAALAKISEMTLFRRFGDKPALFRAALELEAQRFAAEAIAYSGNLEADLTRIVEAYATLLDRSAPIILDFLLQAPRNPDLARIRAVPAETMEKVAMIILQHQTEGRLRAGSPVAALLALLSPLIMGALLARAQPAMLPPITSADRVSEFLAGWGVPDS